MKVGVRRFARFVGKARLAGDFSSQLVSYYQTIAFVPNLVGAFGDILSNFYKSLGISESVTLLLLFSHLVLVVLAGVGLGLLQASLNRVFPAIIGEAILSWAVVSGSLLFLLLLVLVYAGLPSTLMPVMAIVDVVYLAATLYYVVRPSTETYVSGAKNAKRP